MDLGLKSKVALVMAASRGMGRAGAEALAAEGCRVAICARTKADIERAGVEIAKNHGVDVLAEAVDVEDRGASRTFVEAVLKRFGAIDVLVVNCGGPPPGKPLEFDDAAWAKAVDSTLMVAVNWVRAVAPGMIERKWGRIVAITSIAVKQPIDSLILSNTMRSGVTGFCKTMSKELAPHGITVNTICPGLIQTDRILHLAQAQAKDAGISVDEALKRRTADIPAGRIGRPGEVGALIAFLAGEPASYITGTTILVDGGMYRGLM